MDRNRTEMEMEMEMENELAKAVHVLNHDMQSCNRVAANHWLVHFQQTDAAWEVATSILNQSSFAVPDLELQLFAAQLLKRKIQTEGACLQSEARTSLQSTLFLAAKRYSLGPHPLLTQICLALSALVLQSKEWKKPVKELFDNLNDLQGHANGSCAVLELLTVLPEEVIEEQQKNTTVCRARRWHFNQELVAQTPAVLEFLLQQIEDKTLEGIQLHEKSRKVLRCLLSWIRVGCFMDLPHSLLAAHPLLNFVLSSLQVPITFDLAVEVLTELVCRHQGLPQVLLARVHSFKEGLLQRALDNGNEKVIGGLACLLSEIGQAAPDLIAEASSEALLLVDALLRCVTYTTEDCEVADSTLQFWSSLTGCFLGMENERRKQKHVTFAAFVPVFSMLLDALLLRAQVGNNEFSTNEPAEIHDIPDNVAQFRTNMEELIVDICQLLGPTQFVQQLFAVSWNMPDVSIPWLDVEVRLHVLNVVSEIISEEEQPFDFSVLMRLAMLLSNNSSGGGLAGFMCLVQKAMAEVLASYAKWICSSHDAIVPLLLFLASGFSKTASATACAVAFRRLCEGSCRILTEPPKLDIIIWVGEGLPNMHLQLDEEKDIISAVAMVISSVVDPELRNKSLERLLKPSYEAIENLLKTDVDNSPSQHSVYYGQSVELAGRAFYRMGAIFSQLSTMKLHSAVGDDSILLILTQFWPLLKQVLHSRHMRNSFLSVATCKSLCHAIRASGRHFSQLLSEVIACISQKFLSYPHHDCFIRTATLIINEFGHEEEYGPLIIGAYQSFNAAESIAALNSSYICDQEPDLVEAYAAFISAFLTCCPKGVIAAAELLVEESLHKATVCCSAMHRGVSLAAMSYMSCFLDIVLLSLLDSGESTVENSFSEIGLRVCSRSGESLVSGIVYALLGVSAMTRVHKSATLFQQLAAICKVVERTNRNSVLCWNSLQAWLLSTIQSLPPEYLKPGEVETITPSWMNAMEGAAIDYIDSKRSMGGRVNRTYMQGNFGRSFKLILREFVDIHRHIPFGCSPC